MTDVFTVELTRRRALVWLASSALAGLLPVALSCSPDESEPIPEVPDAIAKLGRHFVKTVVRAGRGDEVTDVEEFIKILPDLEVDQ